ncbi:hypothetical protein JR316_0008331 [Psilocybe cubensis]|uniref:Uncharacterized protein n=2 Tax=Psilocybe cubensis TaxID=181762 RepID=A0A8H7XW57_PSICU|nr:hypothetical protein JR316_0008331 [Psilocybe cubensis]KAH9479736.1 hypothetical protein JR316_0008331 [Psilocybe cubensis]
MATTASEARKAEMARLFDLFEKLKSHRARPTSTIDEDAPMEDIRPPSRPRSTLIQTTTTEQDPAIKKLSSIVEKSSTSTRPRRNTVASMIAHGGGDVMPVDESHCDSDAESLSKFPLAERKRFPFTFKHMVHKLYDKDDWVKTIKETLEKSQNEFKPLAEQQQVPHISENDKKRSVEEEVEGGRDEKTKENVIRFEIATNPGTRTRGNSTGRQRSLSIATTGATKGYTPLSPGVRSPGFRAPVIKSPVPGIRSPGAEIDPEVRVVKKRCVGRRKSASGLANNEEASLKPDGSPRRAWVYNAAVSASERPIATAFVACPPAPPSSPTGGRAPSARYQGLGTKNLPSTMQLGGMGTKRRVIPATDAPTATSFAAFHLGPPASPTGNKGPSSRYPALGTKNLPTMMQAGGTGMKPRVVPATDAPAAARFTGFPPGPPPSPTGPSKGFMTKYSTPNSNKLPSTLKERGKPGLKRRGSIEGEMMKAAPMMMPLQQVTNLNTDGLAARRRSRIASKTEDDKGGEKVIEQKESIMKEMT